MYAAFQKAALESVPAATIAHKLLLQQMLCALYPRCCITRFPIMATGGAVPAPSHPPATTAHGPSTACCPGAAGTPCSSTSVTPLHASVATSQHRNFRRQAGSCMAEQERHGGMGAASRRSSFLPSSSHCSGSGHSTWQQQHRRSLSGGSDANSTQPSRSDRDADGHSQGRAAAPAGQQQAPQRRRQYTNYLDSPDPDAGRSPGGASGDTAGQAPTGGQYRRPGQRAWTAGEGAKLPSWLHILIRKRE